MPTFSDAQLITALKETAGIPVLAAKKLGVTRQAVYARIKNDPVMGQWIEDIGAELIDAAEAVVADAILAKDKGMARWFLERKGKGRGYTTRTEVTGKDGAALPAPIVNVMIEYVDSGDVGEVV